MVEDYKKKDFISVLDFVKHNESYDFYFTGNNTRQLVRDEDSLRNLLKISTDVRIIKDKGDVKGIILIWKSSGNNITRYYVKFNATDEKIANNLITVLIWNTKKDLFIKLKKNSKFLKVLKQKGFDFIGDRGSEILMIYPKSKRKELIYDNHNNKSKESYTRL
jgi:ribosomal protein L28